MFKRIIPTIGLMSVIVVIPIAQALATTSGQSPLHLPAHDLSVQGVFDFKNGERPVNIDPFKDDPLPQPAAPAAAESEEATQFYNLYPSRRPQDPPGTAPQKSKAEANQQWQKKLVYPTRWIK
jgi:hypothetical protein